MPSLLSQFSNSLLFAQIGETIGRFSILTDAAKALRLRRINRIRTIRGSLVIEGNTLSEAQITAILDGKRVIASLREIQEVRNAVAAYDRLDQWRPEDEADLLEAHRTLTAGLFDEAGTWRRGGVCDPVSGLRNCVIRNSQKQLRKPDPCPCLH